MGRVFERMSGGKKGFSQIRAENKAFAAKPKQTIVTRAGSRSGITSDNRDRDVTPRNTNPNQTVTPQEKHNPLRLPVKLGW